MGEGLGAGIEAARAMARASKVVGPPVAFRDSSPPPGVAADTDSV